MYFLKSDSRWKVNRSRDKWQAVSLEILNRAVQNGLVTTKEEIVVLCSARGELHLAWPQYVSWGACQLYSGHLTMIQGAQGTPWCYSFSSNCTLRVERHIEFLPSRNRGPPLALSQLWNPSSPLVRITHPFSFWQSMTYLNPGSFSSIYITREAQVHQRHLISVAHLTVTFSYETFVTWQVGVPLGEWLSMEIGI